MFLLALAVTLSVPVYWWALPERARRPSFAAIALAVLASYAPVAVAVAGALTLAVHALCGGAPEPTAAWRVRAAVALPLAVLVAHKYFGLLPGLLLGISYATFRLVHLALEAGRGGRRDTGLLATLEYVLFPPTFLSGPIEREPHFHGRLRTTELTLDDAFWSARRVLTGLAKKVLIVAPLSAAVDPTFAPLATPSPREAWLALFGYALVIYLDFSAYCDMALGVARAYGFVVSENFDWPYFAPSITEFWKRWHITLSTWLRDYIFLPVSIVLGRQPAMRDYPVAIGCIASVVTMLACGMWHGDSWSFVLWGLGHGLASSVHQLWRQHVVAELPVKRRKALAASPVYRVAATILTFLVVSLLWPFFRLNPQAAVAYWRRLLPIV